MTDRDPLVRPSAEVALQQWLELRGTVGVFARARPLEPLAYRFFHDITPRSSPGLLWMMSVRLFWRIARALRLVR